MYGGRSAVPSHGTRVSLVRNAQHGTCCISLVMRAVWKVQRRERASADRTHRLSSAAWSMRTQALDEMVDVPFKSTHDGEASLLCSPPP